MAKENIAEFFHAVMTDSVLAEKLSCIAAENGHVFTAEELLEYGAAYPLTDEETRGAAGGFTRIGIHL